MASGRAHKQALSGVNSFVSGVAGVCSISAFQLPVCPLSPLGKKGGSYVVGNLFSSLSPPSAKERPGRSIAGCCQQWRLLPGGAGSGAVTAHTPLRGGSDHCTNVSLSYPLCRGMDGRSGSGRAQTCSYGARAKNDAKSNSLQGRPAALKGSAVCWVRFRTRRPKLDIECM